MLLVCAAVVSRLGIDSLDKLRGKLSELRGELQDTQRFHDVYNYSFQWACEVRTVFEGRGGGGRASGAKGSGTASSQRSEWEGQATLLSQLEMLGASTGTRSWRLLAEASCWPLAREHSKGQKSRLEDVPGRTGRCVATNPWRHVVLCCCTGCGRVQQSKASSAVAKASSG